MAPEFVSDETFAQAMPYAEYQAHFEAAAAADPDRAADEEARQRLAYTKLNLQRSRRIHKTYTPPAELRAALERLEPPSRWLIITEPWCGDSAQCLPYLAVMAQVNPRIELRLLLRDQNPEVMDRYLTGDKRSIPILVAGDADGRGLFRWGPRPREVATLVGEMLAAGLPKQERLEKLHLWYGRNRGAAITAEMLEILGG